VKSNLNLKQQFLRTVIGGALIAGLLPVNSAFAVAAFPTSGSCAMLVTQPVPYGASLPYNAGYNNLAIITFSSATAATITFHETRLDYKTTGPTVTATHATEANVAATIAPLVAPAPVEGRSITFTVAGGGGTLIANAIAVNGGSTILIQGESEAFSGVCQF
jgi:hypothetical protein